MTTTTVLYPLPPTQLEVDTQETTTSSVKVKWTYDATKSHIEKWRVKYTVKDTNNPKYINTTSASVVEQIISGLKAGQTYTVSVYGVTTDGLNSLTAPEVPATVKPLPVTGLNAVVRDSSTVKVTWAPNTDSLQDSYLLRYQSQHKTSGWTSANILTAQEETLSGLFPGDQYTFEVKAVSGSQISDPQTTTAILNPLRPVSLTVSETTTTSLKIQWRYDDKKSFCEKWGVNYTKTGDNDFNTIVTNSVADQETTIPSLTPGQSYTIQVFGITTNNIVSQTTQLAATVKPLPVTRLKADTLSTTSVKVSWSDAEGSSQDSYKLRYHGKHQATGWTTPLTIDGHEKIVNELYPGDNYTFEVKAVSGNQISATQTNTTILLPNQPSSRCGGEQNAITIYITQGSGWVDSFAIKCNNCTDTLKHQVSKENRFYQYPNLVPDTRYSFTSTAIAGEVFGIYRESTGAEITCLTKEGPPYPVRNFNTTYIEPRDLLLSWTEPEVKNGQLKNYTITYNGTKTGKPRDDGEKLTITVDDPKKKYTKTISNLNAGFTYTFVIRAYNTLEGNASVAVHTMPILPPATAMPVEEAKPVLKGTNDKKSTLTHNSFVIQFINAFSNDYGDVVSYSVIVTKSLDDKTSDKRDIPYWSKMKLEKSISTYVAIEQCANLFSDGDKCWKHSRKRRAASTDTSNENKNVAVTMGGDETCDEKTKGACNGKLSPSTAYYVKLRAFTENGLFTDTGFSEAITTASAPVPWGAIGGGLGAAVFVIVIAVVVMFLLRRQGFFVKKEPSGTFVDPLRASSSRQKPDTSHQIKLVDFPDHWKKMNADSQLQFAAAYEDLKDVGADQSQIAAFLPANRAKNRFTNILPYDRTRIKLMSGGEEEEGTDYINGNWMPGYNSKREYAVVQGPLPGTKDDMWRMIWEHNARAIVMLTNCVEKGREKCDHYWPVDAQPMYYGDLKVEILSENKTVDWIVSTMKVSLGSQSRNITHFHYTAWPDFGVPDNPQSLIGFVRLVRRSLDPVGGPIVVHCSAGVGRSGTFIALDRLLQHIEEHDWVDVYNTVYEMRLYRNHTVQTEAQYICIHNCLLCVLEGREDPDDEGEDNEAYEDDEGYMVKL